MEAILASSPADQAKIQPGDIIDGTPLDETLSYIFKPGDQVPIEVARNNQTLQMQVILGEASSR